MAGKGVKKDINFGAVTNIFKSKQSSASGGLGGIRQFNYSAVSHTGIRQKGKMAGPSADAIAQALTEDGWVPLKISEVQSGGLNLDLGNMLNRKPFKLNLEQQTTFSRQLAELLDAGVPISKALNSISEETDPIMKRLCQEIQEKLSAGIPFSDALAFFPDAFDEVFCAYVSSGEASGTLPETIARLSKTIQKRSAVRKKIKAISSYPKFVSIAIGGIVFGIMWGLVPTFVKIYQGFNKPLPAATQVLVDISNNISPFTFTKTITQSKPPTQWFWFLDGSIDKSVVDVLMRIMLVVALWLGTEFLRKSSGKEAKMGGVIMKIAATLLITLFSYDWEFHMIPVIIVAIFFTSKFMIQRFFKQRENDIKWARIQDKILFKIPVFGALNEKNALFRWTATLAGGVSSGVPLSRAIDIASRTSGSVWHKAVAPKIDESLRSGRGLAVSLNDYRELYPGSLRSMVATGEQTGEIAKMLDNVAAIIDNDIDAVVAGLSAKIEVMLLVVMGTIVGGMVLVLYLPIIQLATIQQG